MYSCRIILLLKKVATWSQSGQKIHIEKQWLLITILVTKPRHTLLINSKEKHCRQLIRHGKLIVCELFIIRYDSPIKPLFFVIITIETVFFVVFLKFS